MVVLLREALLGEVADEEALGQAVVVDGTVGGEVVLGSEGLF